jgi:hypothetical protein
MSTKKQFNSFVEKHYSWKNGSYAINSDSSENKFVRELEKGHILPADIVSYAALVNELSSLLIQSSSGGEEKLPPQAEERRRGRQQWNATSELNWRIDANDSKIDRFRKNVQKMCTNDIDIPQYLSGQLYALSNLEDFRIQDLRPFGLYLGLLFKNMIDEDDEIDDDDEIEEKQPSREAASRSSDEEKVAEPQRSGLGDDVDDWMADF